VCMTDKTDEIREQADDENDIEQSSDDSGAVLTLDGDDGE